MLNKLFTDKKGYNIYVLNIYIYVYKSNINIKIHTLE